MFITHDKFKPKNIRYGFYTKALPVFKSSLESSLNNVAKHFGSNSIATLDQKHTNNVIIIDDYQIPSIADGQIANKPGIALGVFTADCVPILLADGESKVIATVHAGWRGARSDIIQQAVIKMRALGAKNITAIIGPCIKQHNYEVGEEFYQDFISESVIHKKFFMPGVKSERYMFDLPSYVKDKLIAVGISNILDINRDTYAEEEHFFSYRRSTHNPNSPMGSLISVIMLESN